MEAIRRVSAPYTVPAEFRESFAREEHRHNHQMGLRLSVCTLLLAALVLLAGRSASPQWLSALLSGWPPVPILAVLFAFSLAALGMLLTLRRLERIDAPMSTGILLVYACAMLLLLAYQAHLEAPSFGIENINIIVLAMVVVALMIHFPLHITLLLETGALAVTVTALLLDRPYISNFYASLVDIVAVYLLVSVAATRGWRSRIKSFSGTRRLKSMTHIDSLTGLSNRRGFDETLPKVWKRMEAAELPLSLLMIDVDYFKRFNDTYGHQAGDECLRQLAVALTASVRARDFVGRYGGEEFVVLLPGAGLSASRRVGERMAQELAALSIPHAGNDVSPLVTFSAGCACCRPGLTCESPEALVRMADDALYLAKGQGRGRVVTHPDSAE